jgi:hypothetical protein
MIWLLCPPTARVASMQVAVPLERAVEPQPLTSPDQVMEPVAVDAVVDVPVFISVAVNVTDCPKVEGFGEEVMETLVGALLTTWVTLPLLVRLTVSPEYVALTVSAPLTGRAVVVHVDMALATVVEAHPAIGLPPSVQATDPDGLDPPVIAAVKVTDWPKVDVDMVDDEVTVVVVEV